MQERLTRAQRLAESLLRDRAEHEAKPKPVRAKADIEGSGFDPFAYTRWRVVAGGDPGYLVKTPMRRGPIGWHLFCKACGQEFESKGWAYCPTCMDIPAEERRAIKPIASGRLCQAPGCENFIPRMARADTVYCSKACREKAHRLRKSGTDNGAGLSDIGPPSNGTDSNKKTQ